MKSVIFPMALICLLAFSVASEAHAFSIGQCSSYTIGGGASLNAGLNDPERIAFDANGDLWVADTVDNRVLEFNASVGLVSHNGVPPIAAIAIGQIDLLSSAAATSQIGLHTPWAISFDRNGNLWVADRSNSRVLEFRSPFTTGERASLVIGQKDFVSVGGSPSANTMAGPEGLTFDSSGNLWVADTSANRVLEFRPPFVNGMDASLVIGQNDFASFSGVASRTGFNGPVGIVFDNSGNLWVSDMINNRVVEFRSPLTMSEQANLVLGQADFVSTTSALTSTGLSSPRGLAMDTSGNLWVADLGNNRVLEFNLPTSSDSSASLVLGASDFSHRGYPLPSIAPPGAVFDGPSGLAFDSQGNLWVSTVATGGKVVRFDATGTSCLQLSNFLIATSASGQTVQIPLSGNVTSSQVLQTSFQADNSGKISSVSLTVSGRSGTTGTMTLSVPKNSVSAGLVPQVYVNGALQSQTFTQDALYIYVTVTLQFSTDNVLIQFVQSNPLSTTTTGGTTSGSSNGAIPEFPYQLVLAVALTLILVLSYAAVRRRAKFQKILENE